MKKMKGVSGRIVLEIDPNTKKKLYTKVNKNGLTMKDWFLAKAEQDFPELFISSINAKDDK
ncbi:hypothetical protein [Vibrio campbellii]|uniref:hypothetical protein n=1 Tax=Vibrio campbellii TaxID=680 RepID=UPI00142D4E95|nr:hypothetical protein [Vibrio campbellii]NIY90286.1 hypothetical protein [Vibrio campbellii]NVK69880.1 hypothetical protein [Vibrio campbellii]